MGSRTTGILNNKTVQMFHIQLLRTLDAVFADKRSDDVIKLNIEATAMTSPFLESS